MFLQFLRDVTKCATRRSFAAGSSGKKGRSKGPAAEEKPPEVVPDIRVQEGQVLSGLDIFSKEPAPTIAKTYPDWVFSDVDRIYGTKKTSSEILSSLDGDISKADASTMYELKRALKRENTSRIRSKNSQNKMK